MGIEEIKQLKTKLHNLGQRKRTLSHIEEFFRYTEKKPLSGKKILIYAGIGHMYISYFEILLYHLLTKKGYEVDYLIYDEQVPINELITKKVIETKGKKKYWNEEVKRAKQLLKSANINYQYINSQRPEVKQDMSLISSDLDTILSYKKDGINLGEIVKGTMFRYYKSLKFEDDATEIAKKFLYTALSNYYEIKTRCEKTEYNQILFSHGIYVTWEPIAKYCKKNKISFVAYDRAKTKNSININWNQVAPDWSFDSAWNRYSDRLLSSEEEGQVHVYLKDRELQANDVYAYNFSERSNNIAKLKNQLGISQKAKVLTLFTNVIWDAANVSRDIAFENPLECIAQTINTYKDRKDVHIVIRTHPAEKIIGTEERYSELVKNLLNKKVPNNVTIIEPEMAINSFSVIDLSDIGIVNTSTVGLEFALLGKPVILISETHYRNKGFTYDVNSRKQYLNTLEKLLDKIELMPNQIELARKYFFMMMFKYQHFLPMNYTNGIFQNYKYSNIEKIPQDHELFFILNQLENKNSKDFLFWP